MKNINVKITRLNPAAQLPQYAHGPEEDAGFDLRALEAVILQPHVPVLVKTGLAIELPPGYEAQIRSRSGLALKHGVQVYNAPGTVDSGFRGELGVVLVWNGHAPNAVLYGEKIFTADSFRDFEADYRKRLGVDIDDNADVEEYIRRRGLYVIQPGDRIAQMVVAEYVGVTWAEGELAASARGEGGFGSTGK